MLKTLGAQIKEFKKDSFLTPVFMILEVLMETVIPLMMASIIEFYYKRKFKNINCKTYKTMSLAKIKGFLYNNSFF